MNNNLPNKVDANITETLPNNIEAEKSLLGSVFWSYAALQKACEDIDKDVFYSPKNGQIFEVIKELYDKKHPVDINTLTAELVTKKILNQIGGVEYLNELIDSVATGANIEYYINLVLEKFTLRRMIEEAKKIISDAQKKDIDVSSTLETAEKNILNIAKSRKTSEFRNVQEVLTKAQQDLQKLVENHGRVTGLTTGLIDLDKLTEGLHPTQMIIIAARPAVGKTAFALNILTAAAKSTKKNIAMFSLEMPAEQLIMRMISSVGQIDNAKLKNGKMENDDWRRFDEAVSQLGNTNIFFHDAGGVTSSEIKAKCRRLATQGEGLGLVIIDYLQLIDSSSKYAGNRQQEISEISRNLKMLALELEVPVIALSQLSRSVEKREDKKPVLSDLRESGAIEQDADIVAALHAPDVEIPQGDELPVPIQLIVLKHRNGPIGTVDMLFKKRTSTFLSIKKDGGSSAN